MELRVKLALMLRHRKNKALLKNVLIHVNKDHFSVSLVVKLL